METKDLFAIPFNDETFCLNLEQVKELLKISKYNGSNIKLTITLIDNQEVIGTVIEFKGHNPLSPTDVYIPIVFKIKTSEKIEELNFLEIKSIKVDS